jgi:FSR family fosmidomycin resistance protein-like MFS transporter
MILIRQDSYLRERAYIAAATAHFFVDVLNNSRTVLMPLLALSLGLNNKTYGLMALLYGFGNSLTQPIFGLLADRIGPRWLIAGGVAWMMTFFTIGAIAPDNMALMAITLASLGSGAFHPTGTMVAAQARNGQKAQATATFFTAGQMGLFLGPIIAGQLLEGWGRGSYLVLTAAAFLPFLLSWQWLESRPWTRPAQSSVLKPQSSSLKVPGRGRVLAVLFILILTLSTVSNATQEFAPKLFTEMGFSPSYVGWLSGIRMLASAIGILVGGVLADRLGDRWPIFLSGAIGLLPYIFYIPAPEPWRSILLAIAGFTSGLPHSILIVRSQALLPNRQALASGLSLGLMFFCGAVGAWIMGILADQLGLVLVLQWMAGMLLVAAAASYFLPARTSDK